MPQHLNQFSSKFLHWWGNLWRVEPNRNSRVGECWVFPTNRSTPARWVLSPWWKKRKENKTMLISHQRFSSGSPRRRQSSIKRRKRSSRHWGTWGTSFSSSLVLRILASLPYHVTCNACPCVLWKSLSVESFVAASRVQTMKMWKCTLSLAMRQKTPGPGPRKPITKYPDLARKTQPKSNPVWGAGA